MIIGFKYQYHRQTIPAVISLIILMYFIQSLAISVHAKLITMIISSIAGFIIGYFDSQRIISNTSRSRPKVLFKSDNISFQIAQMIAPVPGDVLGALITAGLIIAFFVIFPPAIIAVTAVYFSYNITLIIILRKHEIIHGPIKIKYYHVRSVTGQEGMIGKTGVVMKQCIPMGKVKLNGELWTAKSYHNDNIPEGAEVTIRDVEGLTVFVERNET